MRLDALEVFNYKSIRQVKIEPAGLTCLVGPNNSGKSNLVDALVFIRDVAREGLEVALKARDSSRIRFYGANQSEPTMFEVFATGEKSDGPDVEGYKLHYLLRLNIDSEFAEVEHFERSKNNRTERLFTLSTPESRVWHIDAGPGGGRPDETAEKWVSPLLARYERTVPGCLAFTRFLASFQFYRIVPDFLKRQGPAQRVDRLARDGGNFSSYVHTIQASHRRVFDRIEDELRKNFPGVEDLATHLTPDGATEVAIRERWFDRQAHGHQLSDGLVGFLAHLVALYGPDSPSLVVFEEPENYIHPRLMERLVDMLKVASKDQQIMLSTHSVPLINRLELGDLLIVERGPDGATCTRRIEAKDALREALKDWALGEAYASGVLDDQ